MQKHGMGPCMHMHIMHSHSGKERNLEKSFIYKNREGLLTVNTPNFLSTLLISQLQFYTKKKPNCDWLVRSIDRQNGAPIASLIKILAYLGIYHN